MQNNNKLIEMNVITEPASTLVCSQSRERRALTEKNVGMKVAELVAVEFPERNKPHKSSTISLRHIHMPPHTLLFITQAKRPQALLCVCVCLGQGVEGPSHPFSQQALALTHNWASDVKPLKTSEGITLSWPESNILRDTSPTKPSTTISLSHTSLAPHDAHRHSPRPPSTPHGLSSYKSKHELRQAGAT